MPSFFHVKTLIRTAFILGKAKQISTCLPSSFYHPRTFYSSFQSTSCFPSVPLRTLKEKMHAVRQRDLTQRAAAFFSGWLHSIYVSLTISDSIGSLNHLTLKLMFSLKNIYMIHRWTKQCAKGVNLCSEHGLKRMVNGDKHVLEPKFCLHKSQCCSKWIGSYGPGTSTTSFLRTHKG